MADRKWSFQDTSALDAPTYEVELDDDHRVHVRRNGTELLDLSDRCAQLLGQMLYSAGHWR